MSNRMTVVVFLPEAFNALEMVGFTEALSLVPGTEIVVVADRPGTVTSDSGLEVTASAGIDDVDSAEILLFGSGRIVTLLDDQRTLDWVRRIDSSTRFTTAMCVGRAVLGAAGLLDGVSVAASAVPLPAFGAVEVPQRLVADGKFITGANTSSAIDLGIHVASHYLDEAAARALQVVMEYDVDTWHPPYAGRELPEVGPEVMGALGGLISGTLRERLVRELFDLSGTPAPL